MTPINPAFGHEKNLPNSVEISEQMKKLCVIVYLLLVMPLCAQTWETQDYHGLALEFPVMLKAVDRKELPNKRLMWTAHHTQGDIKISIQYLWDPDGIEPALQILERIRDDYRAKDPDFSGRPLDVDRPEGSALMSFKLDGEDHLIFIATAPYEQWTLHFTAPELGYGLQSTTGRILASLRLPSRED